MTSLPASPLQQEPPRLDFEALFGASPNPYMVLDRELRYVAANAAYLQVTSSRREELLGRHVFDAFPHDPQDPHNAPARMLRDSLERVLRERKPDVLALIPYRVPQHTPDGIRVEERFWSATHTPLLDARGEVAFILQHTVDVTELQRLKQRPARAADTAGSVPSALVEAGVLSRAQVVQEAHRLLEAERRHLLGLFEQAPGFVCFLRGPEHVFELANGAYLQLIGRADVLGKPVREALPEVADQGFLTLLDRVFDSGEPFVGRDLRVELQRRAALDEVYVDFVYQPIRGADGRVSGILVQGQDNTERKAAAAQRERTLRELSEAVRLRDEFLSVASHELKTPLTPLALHLAQLRRELEQGASGPARERELHGLEVAQRQVKKLAALVEELLDTSRLGEGRLPLAPRPVDLGTLVAEVAQRFEPEARRAGCRLQVSAPRGVVGQWDPQRLEQVLANLLSNALKYGPGHPVSVRVEAEGSLVRLAVQDRGIGIHPEVLPRIFGKYERGVSERHYGGLGLGLYVARQLVEAMGGRVQVHSEPNRGATFTVELPLQPPPAEELLAGPEALARLRSEQQRLEATLQRTQDLVDIAPALFGFLSPDGTITDVNGLALKAIEARREDVLGQRFWEAAWWAPLPASAARVRAAVEAAAAGEASRFDLAYRSYEGGVGRESWVALALTPQWDARGQVVRIAATGIDITARRRAEEQRQRALDQVTEVLESMGDAFFVLDREFRLVLTNRNHERVTRTRREETLGRVIWDVFPGVSDPRLKFWDGYHRCMEQRVPVQFTDYYEPLDLWTDVRCYPTADGHIAVFFRDVSEEKRRESALARQAGFEQQLVGIVSHDLRNPLSAIHLVAASLLRRHDLDERSTRGLARIQSSTERALRLVRDLLDFTQARLGQGIRLQRAPVDLHALARQGLVDVQSAFPERELQLDCEGDAQGEWDADRLTQVLVNLTTNALTFSPPDTPVTVRTWDEGAWVGLSVHNAGKPIPPELLLRLFEPLQRGEPEAPRRSGSVGLGLFIVRHLVEVHGGRVTVHSSAPEGTRFTVLLPRRAPGAAPA